MISALLFVACVDESYDLANVSGEVTIGHGETILKVGELKRKSVKDLIKDINIPIKIANDAELALLAENKLGAGKGLENLALITLGTGVGLGLMINGKNLRSTLPFSSEYGHNLFNSAGDSLESLVSTKALTNKIKTAMSNNPQSKMWTKYNLDTATAKTLFDFKDEDEIAKELFNEFIDTREKYKRDVEEFRERRKYFWKYIFNKKFFPKELRTFSLGFILNPFIYIAYNGWHSSVLYTILSVCVIQYFIFPYLHCPEVTASISSFIWILLFVIMLTLSILAPRISWLSRRWASYNYFIDDNMQVNLMLISSWGSIIVYCLVLNLYLTLFLRI